MSENNNFTGATDFANLLIETGKKLQHNEEATMQSIIKIDGQNYYWNSTLQQWNVVPRNIPEDDPVPPTYRFLTLDGLVKYIIENVEGIIPNDERLILHVINERTVRLMSHPYGNFHDRYCIAECQSHVPDITYGRYMDIESFNVQLLSKFVDTPARAELFKVLKSMTREQSCNVGDDGVSQNITVKQGVTLAANVQFQNPVPLRPMRTFSEVEQPESNFVLRVNGDAAVALHEADGSAWINTAVANIAAYLTDRLAAQNNIVVIA